MASPFLDLPAAEILARLTSLVAEAAGAKLVVRVGDERHGCRNIGVDVPRGKTRHAGTLLRLRVREALEAAGVVCAENALSPKVGGSLLGQVQTAANAPSQPSAWAFGRLGTGPSSRHE